MYCPQPVTYTVKQGDTLYRLSGFYRTTVQAILTQNPDVDPYNLAVGSTLLICPGDDFYAGQAPAVPVGNARLSLSNDMRKAWEQHVYWTRMLLISIAQRLEDQNYTADRLLQNPKDIADIFARYYGAGPAETVEQLLTEHLQIGGQLIAALRDKNPDAENLKTQWYANADKMADAFAGISKYYGRTEMRDMLYRHLDLTTEEVAERLAGNYPADIKAFDDVENEALKMADTFTGGIVKDFPQKF